MPPKKIETSRTQLETSRSSDPRRNLFTHQRSLSLGDLKQTGSGEPSREGEAERNLFKLQRSLSLNDLGQTSTLYANFPYRSELRAQVQTENSGGTNRLTNFFSRIFYSPFKDQTQTPTENSGDIEIPTELRARLDQLFSGSSGPETIRRLEMQGLTTTAQVKEGFKQSFEAHKTKILDINRKILDTSGKIPLDEIGDIIEEEQKLLLHSTLILIESIKNLEPIDGKTDKVVNKKVQDKIDAWKEEFPNRQEPAPGSLHYDINVANSEKIQLDIIVGALHQGKDRVNLAVQDLAFYTFPTAEDYNTLRSNIEKSYNDSVKVPLRQYISTLQNELKNANFNKVSTDVQKWASSQIYQIDALIKEKNSELALAKINYENLELVKSGSHPFFLQGDMLDADATITVPPKGYRPGNGLVHMALTILSTRSADVIDEARFAQAEILLNEGLGIHPYGGGVSVKHLESQFAMLSRPTVYQFRKIEPKDLKTALSTGKPIGAFLDTSPVDITSAEDYYPEHTVTLARFERDEITQQDEVVVIDELRTAYNDPSKIAPYRIPIETFAKLGWNGGVFLSKDASDAIDRSQQSAQ